MDKTLIHRCHSLSSIIQDTILISFNYTIKNNLLKLWAAIAILNQDLYMIYKLLNLSTRDSVCLNIIYYVLEY